MKERMKKLTSLLLAANMVALTACGSAAGGDAKVEELGSGDVKWSSEDTGDGWIRVTN